MDQEEPGEVSSRLRELGLTQCPVEDGRAGGPVEMKGKVSRQGRGSWGPSLSQRGVRPGHSNLEALGELGAVHWSVFLF